MQIFQPSEYLSVIFNFDLVVRVEGNFPVNLLILIGSQNRVFIYYDCTISVQMIVIIVSW